MLTPGLAAVGSSAGTDADVRAGEGVARGDLRRVWGYARPHRWALAVYCMVVAVGGGLGVLTPLMLKEIVDRGVLAGRTDVVMELAVVVAATAVVVGGLSLVEQWISARISNAITRTLRDDVYDHVHRLPTEFFAHTSTGLLVARLGGDVAGAQRAVTSVASAVAANGVALVATLVAMVALSWQLALCALLIVPVFLRLARYFGRVVARHTRHAMQLDDELSALTAERLCVEGAMTVRLFGRQERELATYRDRTARLSDAGVRTDVSGRMLFVVLVVTGSLSTALVYGFGGVLVVHGTLPLGTLVALTALIGRVYGPINGLSNSQLQVTSALVGFRRVFEILDLPVAPERDRGLDTGTGAVPDPEVLPALEFDEVRFGHRSAESAAPASLRPPRPEGARAAGASTTVRGVSFTVRGGERVALVGASGAGKTTLAHLACRLYRPDSGAVRLAGIDVADLGEAALARTIGMITQDPFLFHGTVRENIAYGRDGAAADEDRLRRACAEAAFSAVLDGLPDGLDTVVGERGHRLSGGERQRLALARLLVHDPPVVVLDEATAHLDPVTESAVERAVAARHRRRTVLVIAHRPSTVRTADRVVVLERGRVRAVGTHHDLLRRDGFYVALHERGELAAEPTPAAGS